MLNDTTKAFDYFNKICYFYRAGGGITKLLYAPVLGLEGLDNHPHPTPNKMQEPLSERDGSVQLASLDQLVQISCFRHCKQH